jgi:hypothetical protein
MRRARVQTVAATEMPRERETVGGPPGRSKAWPWGNGGGSDASLVEKKGKEMNWYVCKKWQLGNFVTQKQVKARSEVVSSL